MEKTPTTLRPLGDTGRTVADPAEDVRGMTVLDSAGEDLGTVDELLVDDGTTRVHFLRITHGGLLGFGASASLVPVEAVTAIDEDAVHVDVDQERVAGAPVYDPDMTDEIGYYESLYGFYGWMPFWAGGYAYPELPVLRSGPREHPRL
ncbi:PRC-barrel domain-containing protein [Kineosporia sp. R_H_3]|uniref:PRC-barrel domain-containing protein n=1 Tax=Kineosporia sp. R_H_3 TaxID=1961848 RepID=UPI000B4A60BA|nr:PRC-barrel domain-containing protein [Kineosporia sp. R_H_3]